MGRMTELEVILECISEINRLRLLNPEIAQKAAISLKEVIAKWTKIDIERFKSKDTNSILQPVEKLKEEHLIDDLIFKVFGPYTMLIDERKQVGNIDFVELSNTPLWDDITTSTDSVFIATVNKLEAIKGNIRLDDVASVNEGMDELRIVYKDFIRNLNKYYLDQQVYLLYLISNIQYLIEKKSFNNKKDYSGMNKGIWAGLYEELANILATSNSRDLVYEISNKNGRDVKKILEIVCSIYNIETTALNTDVNLIPSLSRNAKLSIWDKVKISFLQQLHGDKNKPKIKKYNTELNSIELEYIGLDGRLVRVVENFSASTSLYLMECKANKRKFVLGEDEINCLDEYLRFIDINMLGIKFYYCSLGYNLMPLLVGDKKIFFTIFDKTTSNSKVHQIFIAHYKNGVLTISEYESDYKAIPHHIFQMLVANNTFFFKYVSGLETTVVKKKLKAKLINEKIKEEGYLSQASFYHNGYFVDSKDNGITKEIIDAVDNMFDFPEVKEYKPLRPFDDKDVIIQLMNDIFPIEFKGRLEKGKHILEKEYIDVTSEEWCLITGNGDLAKVSLNSGNISITFTLEELLDDNDKWRKWLNRPAIEKYEQVKSISS